jgi:hypothetical protein
VASFVITLGTTGLVKADLDLRYYLDGTEDAVKITAATVVEIGASGDYLVSGLPAVGPGAWATVTWEYPAGVGGWYVYPSDQTSAPPFLVLPIREAGLAVGDLAIALYKDGVARVDVLTSTAVGADSDDYRVTGWPTDEAGDWVLAWTRHGIVYNYGWTVDTSSVSCDIVTDLSDMFGDTVIAIPGDLDTFGDFIASGATLSLPCYIDGTARLVRDRTTGQQTVSSMAVLIAGNNNLDVDTWRFTLPGRFDPHVELKPIGINKASDEHGACYEEILFE